MRSARLTLALESSAFVPPADGIILVLRPHAGDDLSALPRERVEFVPVDISGPHLLADQHAADEAVAERILIGRETCRLAIFVALEPIGEHGQILGIQDLVALLVDDLALVVGHVVVFEQLLADVEVAGFDLALRALDAARDDAGLDGLTLGHLQAVHDGAHAVARKNAHQGIVQAQIKA